MYGSSTNAAAGGALIAIPATGLDGGLPVVVVGVLAAFGVLFLFAAVRGIIVTRRVEAKRQK